MTTTPEYTTTIFETIVHRVQDSMLVARVIEKSVDEAGGLWKVHIHAGLSGDLFIEIHRVETGWRLYVLSNQNPKQYDIREIDDVERMFLNPQLLMV